MGGTGVGPAGPPRLMEGFCPGFLAHHASPNHLSQDLLDSLLQGETRPCPRAWGVPFWPA